MQEQLNEKTIGLAVSTSKMTANVLKEAMKKFLEEGGKGTPTKVPHGKQSMKQLMKQNAELTNIEITDGNIRSFERVARKYHIDFCLKKDKSVTPPRYIVFFKAKDVDVMTAAFKEYTKKQLNKEKRPSILKRLLDAINKQRKHERSRERERQKDRGESR